MEQPPPLTPEQISERQQANMPDIGQPQMVKIFGVFHLLLGGLGVLVSLWSLVVIFMGNPIERFLPKDLAAQMAEQRQMQEEMQSEVLPVTIVNSAFYILVTVLIIVAGIKLLKRRKDGLKWSNRYAISSLVGKVVSLPLTLIFTIPAMNKMNSELSSGASGVVDIVMTVSIVLGILVTCIYPALVLILLNRPRVKGWFAARPG